MMNDPAQRDRMMGLVRSVTSAGVVSDTTACLDYLSDEPKVKGSRVGCVGYCMGGSIALRAAGTFPDRVAAAASIYGAGLATDQPDSPHRLLGKVRGAVYVAVAGIDPWLQPGETERLREALVAAGTRHASFIPRSEAIPESRDLQRRRRGCVPGRARTRRWRMPRGRPEQQRGA